MFLPNVWLRKRWLEHSLRNYPLYDPPHKVEERVLPKELALENFEYFMRVRERRVQYFRIWLRRNFWTKVQADENGVSALNRWAVGYAGLLLPDQRRPTAYFAYDPPWTGEAAGCNVLFDMGTAFGEFIIAHCPKLRWEMDPISLVRPKDAKVLKTAFGSSFQRPAITGFDNPNWIKDPLARVYAYAFQMKAISSVSGLRRFYRLHHENRRTIKYPFTTMYRGALREYLAGDPATLYGSVGITADWGDDDG
jgi:hypothetical protein